MKQKYKATGSQKSKNGWNGESFTKKKRDRAIKYHTKERGAKEAKLRKDWVGTEKGKDRQEGKSGKEGRGEERRGEARAAMTV